MSLSDRAREARARADQTHDPHQEAVADALEAAEAAEAARLIREQFPLQSADPDPPKWSEVSKPGEFDGPIF